MISARSTRWSTICYDGKADQRSQSWMAVCLGRSEASTSCSNQASNVGRLRTLRESCASARMPSRQDRERRYGIGYQHRGGQNGGGNHRGSVFRKHVGRAIIARDGLQDQYPRWNEGSSAARDVVQSEFELEQQVTRFIGDMGVAWIAVPDEPDPRSDRHLIEQSSIALLASKGHAADPSSAAWLGRHAPAAAIRASGLWNVRHVGETPRLEFFDRLEAHAAATP